MLLCAVGRSAHIDERPTKVPQMSDTKAKSRSREGKIMLKSCPRCRGPRRIERDPYGWYVMCFTCGYTTYPSTSRESYGADRKSA